MNPRRLTLVSLLLVGTFALAQEGKDRSAKELIGDLERTLERVLQEQEKARDREQLAERCKKYADKAEALLNEFEKAHPKSDLLAEAQALTLKIYDECPDPAL